MRGDDRFDVFLSYNRSDGEAAAELNNWLCDKGLRTFFDRSDLRRGLQWFPALEEAIGRSDAVAILFGKHGIGNTQQYERQFALFRQTREAEFPVIPVLMPGCESPPTGFLQLLTWVDLSEAASVLQQPDNLASLRAALRGERIAASTIRDQVCPYRGLEPFREEDAPFFCGRDDVIRNLVAKVQAHVFVAVVGASGSGKSSLVFAGLLPALRKESQTRTWDVVSFRPGKSPLGALAEAVGMAPEHAGPAEIDAYLKRETQFYRDGDADTLARIVDRRLDGAPEKPDRLLIYIDQWEELYAMAPAAEDKEHLQQHTSDVNKFTELLVAASSGARSRATVVLTVRADFYKPLVQSLLISKVLPQQQVNIPLMESGDLRSAIEKPAKNAGLSFSPPGLVDQILNDVGSEEGRLPLLQFALKEMWERRQKNKLTAEAYTAVGGVVGAIEKTAESVYNRLTPTQQDAAQQLFLRLVTPGEGQEDTRARSLIPDDPQQRDVINLFSDPKTRLLVTGFTPLQGPRQAGDDIRATVEVAHEALIQRWPTLQAWVNGSREKLRARTAILRAMAEWNENGKIDTFLLDPGVQLERGRSLIKDPGGVPVDDIRDFVDLSIKKDEDRLAAEREAALADEKRIAEAERQAKVAAENEARQSEVARDAERRAREAAENEARQSEVARDAERRARETAENEARQSEVARDAERRARETAENARAAAEVARRKLRNRFATAASAAVIAVVALIGVGLLFFVASENAERATMEAARATVAADEARAQLLHANQAVAAEILADFDLKGDNPLTARQRNALWKLATADETVRAQFISTLSASGEEIARIAAGFREVSRSLGLQWPSPVDAEKLLPRLLQQLSKTTNLRAHQTLATALQAVASKLTEAQVQQAFSPLLQQIGKATDPDSLRAPAEALQALPAKLTEAQVQQAFAPLLQQIGEITDPDALQALATTLQAMAAKLTEAQAQPALAPLLQQIGKTTDPDSLQALAEALQALPAKLTDAQAQQVLAPLVQQIGETTNPHALQALAEALQALPARLTDAQAQQALAPLLQQIGERTNSRALGALDTALQAMAAKLTEAQAQQALAPLLQQIGATPNPDALQPLAEALQALPAKLTDTQAQEALAPLLQQIGNPDALKALATALPAMAAKLTEAQAQEALAPLLQQIGKTTNSDALQALAEALQALPARLTDAQAQQALAPLLQQIGKTTNSDALRALAKALQAVAAKLTEAQAQQAFTLAVSSLAWAATEGEAADWARTVVALSRSAADQADKGETRKLVSAIAYPPAAGPATEVLLDALRARRSDVPAKEAGTAVSLAWIAEKYPNEARRPICPPPPQPTSLSDLKCPSEDLPLSNAPKDATAR